MNDEEELFELMVSLKIKASGYAAAGKLEDELLEELIDRDWVIGIGSELRKRGEDA